MRNTFDAPGGLLRKERAVVFGGVLVGLLSWPAVACADLIVPTLVFAWPGMVVLLIPIIAVEGTILRVRLGLTLKRALGVATVANLASTVVGVPVGWALTAVVDNQATWFGNAVDGFSTSLTTAFLVLVIPCFLASWGIEYLVVRRMVKDATNLEVNLAVLIANAASYLLITALLLGMKFFGGL